MSEPGAVKEELERVSAELEELRHHFFQGTFGVLMLPTEKEAKWSALVREAKSLMDEALGPLNDFSGRLNVLTLYTGSVEGGASVANIEEVREQIAAVIRRIARQSAGIVQSRVSNQSAASYIDGQRLVALRRARSNWDFSRLLRICEEINVAWESKSYHAVAMLGRTILDHVPPLFGQPDFGAVMGQYGDKSFKEAMKHLDGGLRSIADGHLHAHIRAKEALPSANQVDFRSGIDRLLAEIATQPWTRVVSGTSRQSAPEAAPKPKHMSLAASDLAMVRILLRLWHEKLLQLRSRNGALHALQTAACSDFLSDVEALYGAEIRRRMTKRFPSFVDPAVGGGLRDLQMKTAATVDLEELDNELTVDRLSPDRPDLPHYVRERVQQLRAEAPLFGLGG